MQGWRDVAQLYRSCHNVCRKCQRIVFRFVYDQIVQRKIDNMSSTDFDHFQAQDIDLEAQISDVGDSRNEPAIPKDQRFGAPLKLARSRSTRSIPAPSRQSSRSSRSSNTAEKQDAPETQQPAVNQAKHCDSEDDEDNVIENQMLFRWSEKLRREEAEPWFLEMTTLRRLSILHLNKQLAWYKKKISKDHAASNKDMRRVRALLREQGTFTRPMLRRRTRSLTCCDHSHCHQRYGVYQDTRLLSGRTEGETLQGELRILSSHRGDAEWYGCFRQHELQMPLENRENRYIR